MNDRPNPPTRRATLDGLPVVYKRIPDASDSPELVALRSVAHPHIPHLVGDRHANGEIIMTDVGQVDLRTAPPRTPDEALVAAASTAATIADLHDLGWAHGAIEAAHVVRGQLGRISLVSLRRARPVDDPASLAARADVQALGRLIRTWSSGMHAHDRPISRRLDDAAALAERPEATARQVATALGVQARIRAGDTRPSRPREGQRSTFATPAVSPARSDLDRPSYHLIATLVAHALVAATCGLALLAFRPGSSGWLSSATPAAGSGAGVVGLQAGIGSIAATGFWAIALVSAGYSALVHLLAAVAVRSENRRLLRLVGRIAPRLARRTATAVGLVGAVAAVTVSQFDPGPATEVAMNARVVTIDRSEAVTLLAPGSTSPPTTSPPTTSPPTTSPPTTSPPTTGAPTTIPVVVPPVIEPPAPSDEVWVVSPGDHLWSIAAATLRSRWGLEPTDAQTGRYWESLVAANRDRLVRRHDPDLIHVGQTFVLPPVPAP